MMVAWTPPLRLLRAALALVLGLLALTPATAHATISLVGQTTAENGAGAATIDVNLPAGVQAGDILYLGVRGTSGTAIPTPPGWSVQYSLATWYGYSASIYKVAN